MKVIKEGKKDVATMQVTCAKCNAVLEVEAADFEVTTDNTQFQRLLFKFCCPCCNRANYLTRNEIAKEILDDLHK